MKIKRILYTISALTLLLSCESGRHGLELDLIPAVLSDGTYCYVSVPGGQKAGGPYLEATYFRDGLALVKDNDGWVFIGRDFAPVGDGHYTGATLFSRGIAVVSRDNAPLQAIDMEGNVVETIDKDSYSAGISVPRENGKADGGEALAAYDEADRIGPDTWIVRKDGSCGIASSSGEILVPLQRDMYFFLPENDISRHGSVDSGNIDLPRLLDSMQKTAEKLSLDPMTMQCYMDTYGIHEDSYGWKLLEEERNLHYRARLMAFVDRGGITRLGVEYTLLSDWAKRNRNSIENQFKATVPGCTCTMDKLFLNVKPFKKII